jgi:peptide-methionine (S)-S-oxide reductase
MRQTGKAFRWSIGWAIVLVSVSALWMGSCRKETVAMDANAPATNNETAEIRAKVEDGAYRKATFAAGCFWGVESAFRQVDGVVSTQVGYTGGHEGSPTYREVCSGRTGHAEAVEVVYDPEQVSYDRLLEVFWSIHDPTTLNRQGPDVGSQYRSAVFTHSDRQHETAEESRDRREASGEVRGEIVTEITPAETFWRAEEYHQQYFAKKGVAPSCHRP